LQEFGWTGGTPSATPFTFTQSRNLKPKTRQEQKVSYIIRPGNAGVCVCERERDGGWLRGINPRRQFEGKVEFQFKM